MPDSAYRSVPITECHEPLVGIPDTLFAVTCPHPYVALGAPYGNASPWMLRQGVLDALSSAQARLEQQRPGWRLKLFDAYRPVPVQYYMVWREFGIQAGRLGISLSAYHGVSELQARDPAQYALVAAKVFEFWGVPSDDPRTPPPHSTGAAVDLTLQDASGREIDMGCPIDETSARAYPDHFAGARGEPQRSIHEHRELLCEILTAAGFSRHTNEWWHFSLGDQMWAWARGASRAIYGRAVE